MPDFYLFKMSKALKTVQFFFQKTVIAQLRKILRVLGGSCLFLPAQTHRRSQRGLLISGLYFYRGLKKKADNMIGILLFRPDPGIDAIGLNRIFQNFLPS